MSKAGNLCTREYSVLRFFGFDADFTLENTCIVGIQCIQFMGKVKTVLQIIASTRKCIGVVPIGKLQPLVYW